MLEFLNRDPTKLPEVPQPEQSSAPFVAFVLVVAQFLLMASAIVGLFMGAFVFVGWVVGIAFALYVAGRFVLPS
jgi:hypothetical protein